jgi:hypothetical protein
MMQQSDIKVEVVDKIQHEQVELGHNKSQISNVIIQNIIKQESSIKVEDKQQQCDIKYVQMIPDVDKLQVSRVTSQNIKDYCLSADEQTRFELAFKSFCGIGRNESIETIDDYNYGLFINLDNDCVRVQFNNNTYYFPVDDIVCIKFRKNTMILHKFITFDSYFKAYCKMIHVYLDGKQTLKYGICI